MINALIVSNIILWFAVLGLAAVVLALLRQIGVLHERVAPAGALMHGTGPRVGEAAPVLRLADWSGEIHTIGGPDPQGRSTLLLFVSPTCPVCKTMLEIVAAVLHDEPSVRLVLASDGARAEHADFVRQHHLDQHPYVLSTELGVSYHVAKLPYAVLVDAEGIIRAKGLVNTREHLESLFQAKERGVASLQEFLQHSADSTTGGSQPSTRALQ